MGSARCDLLSLARVSLTARAGSAVGEDGFHHLAALVGLGDNKSGMPRRPYIISRYVGRTGTSAEVPSRSCSRRIIAIDRPRMRFGTRDAGAGADDRLQVATGQAVLLHADRLDRVGRVDPVVRSTTPFRPAPARKAWACSRTGR